MRIALPLLALAFLAIGIVQFGRHVHAQDTADGVRLKVEGDRLIRIERLTTEAPISLPVLRFSEHDIRQRALESAPPAVRRPDAEPEQARQRSAGDSLPKLQDGERISGSEQYRPGLRLMRVPAPGQSQPEVRFIEQRPALKKTGDM